jgi:hypothetical protein
MAKTNPILNLGDCDGNDEWRGQRTIRRFSLSDVGAKMAKTNPISDLDGNDEWCGQRKNRRFRLFVIEAKKAKTNPISDLGDCDGNGEWCDQRTARTFRPHRRCENSPNEPKHRVSMSRRTTGFLICFKM